MWIPSVCTGLIIYDVHDNFCRMLIFRECKYCGNPHNDPQKDGGLKRCFSKIPETFLTCLLQNVKLLYDNVIHSNNLVVTMVTIW